MKKWAMWGATWWLAMGVSGAFAQAPAAPESEQAQRVRLEGEKYIKGALKNPGSAQFRGQFAGRSGVPCGEVSWKDDAGADSGFRRYIASGTSPMLEGEGALVAMFDRMWAELCQK